VTEFADRLGRNFVVARKGAGLSQEEVGIRAELHRTEVGMLERGVRVPRVDTLLKLAGAIGVSPCELLAGLDWRPAIPVPGGFRVVADASGEAA
jgi:transcriptional regulator with XRE-family HTH domain